MKRKVGVMIRLEKPGANERMRPKLDANSKTQRVQIVAPQSWLDRVEEWRAQQRPVPNLSAAIRQLGDIALEAELRRRERRPKKDTPEV